MRALVLNRIIATRLGNLGLGKVHAVGLNPTDLMRIDFMGPSNRIISCNYASEVIEVGKLALGGRGRAIA